jgi:hypothetical protein
MWADKKRGEHDPASIDLVPGHAPGLVAFMGPEAAFVDAVTGAVQIVAVAHDTPRTLAPPSPQIPTAIAGDGQTVFWLTPAPAVSLNSAPREEGAPTVLAQGLTAASLLRLDDTSVYWVEPGAGTIHAMPKTGGSVRTVAAAGPGTSDLVSDGTRLFWTNAKTGTVSGVPVGGGEVQTLVTDLDEPRFVAVDGAAVFFESGGTVYRRPK